jgi:enoyl-CoA hydratase/carnithine racemase
MTEPARPDDLLVDVAGSTASVTINRPDKRNAVTTGMWLRIAEVMPQLAATPGIRLIVIRGAGGVFSAGADLHDVLAATSDPAAAELYCHQVVGALLAIGNSAVPTVAALDGLAAGGGVEIAIAADIRIATENASCQLPFARLGVVPDAFTLYRLRELIGAAAAQWMVLSGRTVGAESAARMGLIDDLVPAGGLASAIAGLAANIDGSSGSALASTRSLLRSARPAFETHTAAEPMISSFVSGAVAAAAGRFTTR